MNLPPTLEQPAAAGSRRRRIWELEGHAQCPVVGVCLPLPLARRLADKVLGGQALAGDYELHCGLVHDCKTRTGIAEAVQRALDERHAGPLRLAARCKTAETLAAWWHGRSAGAGLPGALWAVLTHPRCSAAIETAVLGEVHMRQHQVGHAERAEQARLAHLETENARLQQALEQARGRLVQQGEALAGERDRLHAEQMRLRGQLLAREALVSQLHDEADAARRDAPDLPARRALAGQLAVQAERLRELQRALNQASEQVQRLRAMQAANEPVAGAPAADAGDAADALPLPDLVQRTVLCVGGRTATVPVYRRLLEDLGARFVHHDGGQEDNVQRLQASLAAADLVICQAGCVSHDAYWRVKDHCKRTGKRCVFVDTPSVGSLRRALRDAATDAQEATDAPPSR